MHDLNLISKPQTVNTFETGAHVTFRAASGDMMSGTVATDRGGDVVRIKTDRGFSWYIQRAQIVTVNLCGLGDLLNAIARWATLQLDPSPENLRAIYRAQGDNRPPATNVYIGATGGRGQVYDYSSHPVEFRFGQGYVYR